MLRRALSTHGAQNLAVKSVPGLEQAAVFVEQIWWKPNFVF